MGTKASLIAKDFNGEIRRFSDLRLKPLIHFIYLYLIGSLHEFKHFDVKEAFLNPLEIMILVCLPTDN